MSLSSRAAALVFAVSLSGPGLAAAAEPPVIAVPSPEAESGLKGVVGVCVRWGADDDHVAEAVVVNPSGNATLDAMIPETIRALTWQRPAGDDGAWRGLNVSVDGAPLPDELPSCTHLTQAERPPAPPPSEAPPAPPPALAAEPAPAELTKT